MSGDRVPAAGVRLSVVCGEHRPVVEKRGRHGPAPIDAEPGICQIFIIVDGNIKSFRDNLFSDTFFKKSFIFLRTGHIFQTSLKMSE